MKEKEVIPGQEEVKLPDTKVQSDEGDGSGDEGTGPNPPTPPPPPPKPGS